MRFFDLTKDDNERRIKELELELEFCRAEIALLLEGY